MTDKKKALDAIDGVLQIDLYAVGIENRDDGESILYSLTQEEVETIKRLSEASKALLEDGGWRDIESAPKDIPILVKTEINGRDHENCYHRAVVKWYDHYPHKNGVWRIAEADEPNYIPETITCNPTHWKPLDSEARALEILKKIGGK